MTHGLSAVLQLVALAGCSGASQPIECPAPEVGGNGMLRETAKQIGDTGARLGRGNENEIGEAAASLRARHAGASKAEIVNYLVTAYCPRVNQRPELDQAAKRQALNDFLMRAERIVR